MAKDLLNLGVEWTASPTSDELSSAVRVGIKTVCIVGGHSPEDANTIAYHLVALRNLARAAAACHEASEAYGDLVTLDQDNGPEILDPAAERMLAAREEFEQALRNIGDPLIARRDARAKSAKVSPINAREKGKAERAAIGHEGGTA